jgi:hypothetical protein
MRREKGEGRREKGEGRREKGEEPHMYRGDIKTGGDSLSGEKRRKTR